MGSESKISVGDMFAYKYNDTWFCCLTAYKNVWSQFPLAVGSDIMFLFSRKFDIQPDMPNLADLLSSEIIAFRTILPKNKPRAYIYIGKYFVPQLDIGLKGDGVFISSSEISKLEINHSIVSCTNGRCIAIPYFDLQGKQLDYVPKIKVGNSIFHCTKGINEIIGMCNNNVLDII